jgi:hypothetical protein
MKQLLIVALAIALTGCFYQVANTTDLRKTVYFCKGVENIDELQINADGSEDVTCIDGSREQLDNVNLPIGETK